jgi:ABC-type uncharacterized transport system substrate-binding protein
MDDLLIISQRARIVDLAMQRRLPVMGEFKPFATAGALMSYAPDQIDMWRRAAGYVDKILKGSKPADLPVEQPINVGTAAIAATSVNVTCTAVQVQSNNIAPVSIPLHMTRFNPIPGTQE